MIGGETIQATTPRVTLLGHADGTTLRGGVGIEILYASRTTIRRNTISDIVPRHPFPGNTLDFRSMLCVPLAWRDANGAGIWTSAGSKTTSSPPTSSRTLRARTLQTTALQRTRLARVPADDSAGRR